MATGAERLSTGTSLGWNCGTAEMTFERDLGLEFVFSFMSLLTTESNPEQTLNGCCLIYN